MRFLLPVVLIIASAALLVLDMTTPHIQAASVPAPNCLSAIPSPVPGTPAPAPTAPGTLFINEVLTKPNTAWNCADPSPSTKDAWIELYNAQNQPVALTSSAPSRLIINAPQENNPPFIIPASSVIAPHGFLVLFPLTSLSILTITSVQLIIGNAQSAIDSVSSIPSLAPDQSYARIPDGNPHWQISNYPTPGTSNSLTPPTPTPTPTKATKVRITRTKTPKAGRSSKSNSNTSDTITFSNDNNATASSTNDGIQPSWRSLQFPDGTAALPVTQVTGMPSSTTAQQTADTSDLPKKIIISVSVSAVACALFWCWKHFLSS